MVLVADQLPLESTAQARIVFVPGVRAAVAVQLGVPAAMAQA
jgi:hypothetical protein